MKICERCRKKNQKFSLFCHNAPVVKFIFISKNLTPYMHRLGLLPLGAVVLTLEGYFLSWTPQGRRQSSGWWWFSSSYSTYSGLHMSHLHAIRLCSGASSSKVRKRPSFFICQKDNYQAREKNDLCLNVYWLGMRFWHPNFWDDKMGFH